MNDLVDALRKLPPMMQQVCGSCQPAEQITRAPRRLQLLKTHPLCYCHLAELPISRISIQELTMAKVMTISVELTVDDDVTPQQISDLVTELVAPLESMAAAGKLPISILGSSSLSIVDSNQVDLKSPETTWRTCDWFGK
jgi:hypothetical protein